MTSTTPRRRGLRRLTTAAVAGAATLALAACGAATAITGADSSSDSNIETVLSIRKRASLSV